MSAFVWNLPSFSTPVKAKASAASAMMKPRHGKNILQQKKKKQQAQQILLIKI